MPGFTLVELLTVIAVVGLLAALLLPALHKAKQAAESAACKSNLHQLGIVLNLYVLDFQRYPTWRTGEMAGTNRWTELRSYLEKDSPLAGWSPCPVARRLPGLAYGYNTQGTGYNDGAPEMQFGLGGTTRDPDTPLPDSGVLVPSDMLAFLHRFEVFSFFGFGWPGVPEFVHHGGENAVFCDAHVEASDARHIPTRADHRGSPRFIPDSAHAKRWNIDNQPHPETWK